MYFENGDEKYAHEITHALYNACPLNPGYGISVTANPQCAVTRLAIIPEKSKERFFITVKKKFALWLRNERTQKMQEYNAGLHLGFLSDEILNALNHTFEIAGAPSVAAPTHQSKATTHLCGFCSNEYDMRYGDALIGIPPQTLFQSLPESWLCPVCNSPKNVYA